MYAIVSTHPLVTLMLGLAACTGATYCVNLTHLEEGVPVDVAQHVLQREVVVHLGADELGLVRLVLRR